MDMYARIRYRQVTCLPERVRAFQHIVTGHLMIEGYDSESSRQGKVRYTMGSDDGVVGRIMNAAAPVIYYRAELVFCTFSNRTSRLQPFFRES